MNGWLIALLVYGCGFVITAVWVIVATRVTGLKQIIDKPGYEELITGIVFLLWPILWAIEITALVLSLVNRNEKASKTS